MSLGSHKKPRLNFLTVPTLFWDDPELAGDASPASEVQARIENELRLYLGREGYRLFAACAFYPEVRPELISALAQELGMLRPSSLPISRHELAARLAGLPWFRRGYLPVWLRKRTVGSLSVEVRRDLKRIIVKLFSSAEAAIAADLPSPPTFGNTSSGRVALPIRFHDGRHDGVAVDAVTIGFIAKVMKKCPRY